MRARYTAGLLALAAALLGGCGLGGGGATPVNPGTTTTTNAGDTGLPPGHPAVTVAEPAANNHRVGRVPRRVDVDQLRAALVAATGHAWLGEVSAPDPATPQGRRYDPRGDLLTVYAGTLGRADFFNTTRESHDPTVPFSKLAGDAARAACASGVAEDLTLPADRRRIIHEVAPEDTLAGNAAGVARNLSYLTLRFWGRRVPVDSEEIAPLRRVFERVSTAAAGTDRNGTARAAGTPADGWRAVCIALATDPQFSTY